MTSPATEIKRLLSDITLVVVGNDPLLLERLVELKRFGAEVISLPAVDTVGLENPARLDEALEHLYGYDWILFTNPDAVNYFLKRLDRKGLELIALDDLRVCAVGNATEELLLRRHIHVDVVPMSQHAAAVFSALERFAGGSAALRGLNFLQPRASSTPDALTRALTEAGARVDLVPTYRVSLGEADSGRTAAMLAGSSDCLVLSGPEAISQLTRLFDTQDLQEALGEIPVFCFDETVLEHATDAGLMARTLSRQTPAELIAQQIAIHLAA